MVNEKLIIPKENIYKTEEVRYLDNNEFPKKQITEKDFFISCPDSDEAREGTKKTMEGVIGTTSAVEPEAGLIMGAVAAPVGKAVEGIGEATGCKEAKVVGQGTQDAVKEPLEKVSDKLDEAGDDIKEGFEDLGDKLDDLFN
jgi:hypothetical protein